MSAACIFSTVWVDWLCRCTVSLSLLSGVMPQLLEQIYLTMMKRKVRIANVGYSQQAKEIRDMKREI